jgi:L-ascorbate metabolism protein UlaG (beta-lactamase superfamily)
MLKVFGARPDGLRPERMQASPRWAGAGFRNVNPIPATLRDTSGPRPSMRDFLFEKGRRRPTRGLPSFDPRPTWSRTPQSGLRATWLGHSTVLLEIDGWRILTDPVWGGRASPFTFLGPSRFQPAAVPLDKLGRIDVVAISHDHYDHLDYPTIRALAKTGVPFVTSLGVGAHLEAWGVAAERITELDWWQTHTVPGTGIAITAAPSQHFSGRGLSDRNATLWSSFAIRGPRHAVFFSGDTGLTTEYEAIRDRLGPFDLVMLEVGAFHPSWGDIHLGPEHALDAWKLLGGGPLLPIHWGTFALAMHDWDEPAETLHALAASRGAPLVMPRLGEAIEPAHAAEAEAWWRTVDQGIAVPPSVSESLASADAHAPLAMPLD